MHEHQRTLLIPGQGITRAQQPTTEFKRYPLMMTHDGYQPASIGKEVVHESGRYKYHVGGTAIRFGPVLVKDADQEAYHAADGYKPNGTMDEAAFAKAVASFTPPVVDYKPVEYPKFVNGTIVNSVEEEAELLGHPAPGSSEMPGGAPSVSAEVNTIFVSSMPPIKSADQIRIEELEATVALLVQKLDGASLPGTKVLEPEAIDAAIRQAMGPTTTEVIELVAHYKEVDAVAAKKKTRSEAIKAGIAARKARLAGTDLPIE